MLLSWPLPSALGKADINRLMEMLISKIDYENSAVRNYQMELIGLFSFFSFKKKKY